jgi:hypothetical protein
MNGHSLRVASFVCWVFFVAVQGVLALSGQGAGQGSSVNTTGYSAYDSFPVKLTATKFTFAIPPECVDTKINVSDTTSLLTSFATSADSTVKPACILKGVAPDPKAPLRTPGNGIILHVTKWKTVDTPAASGKPEVVQYQPLHGAWGFYIVEKDRTNLRKQADSSGTPYFYNVKHVYLVDINLFDDGTHTPPQFGDGTDTPAQVEIDYSIQGTVRQKQNEADLAALLTALLKLSTPKGPAGAASPDSSTVLGIWQEITPGVPLPYDLSVTIALNSVKGANPSTNPCAQSIQGGQGGGSSQTACSANKTVTNYDPEYWDVSLGLAIPGPVETTYKSTTSSGTTTVTPSKVTHTDAYAFVDIYLFQKLATSPGGLSSLPHFNFGLPITSQVFHRPYVGMAENLTFLTRKLKLGVPLSVFAGPVFMKQQIELPGTTTLKWDRATKMMYGVELPISSITNYLKGGSSSKSSGSSKSGGSSGNGSASQ